MTRDVEAQFVMEFLMLCVFWTQKTSNKADIYVKQPVKFLTPG